MATLFYREDWIEIVGSTVDNDRFLLMWRSTTDRTRTGTITLDELLELAPSAVPF